MKTQISDEKFKEELIDSLNSGDARALTKTNFYELLRTKYKIEKQRSLDLYDRFYFEIQTERNEEKIKSGIKEERKKIEGHILNKKERMVIASNIARGIVWKAGNDLIAPSASERVKAMEYLSKIEGDFETVQADITVNLKKIDEVLETFTDEKLNSLLEKLT
ncbi:hypothetical protein SAMN05443429_10877 [Cruoricaptor ignavus]|uniref:Uncharacterized protein n=1 Tax=Cruoricaptor ignavus TaxID=1118202 RepID=A0A1M6G6H0_9FLAO|nr:hypothetical protein [Cruoricaptor ignavus]SHJ05568.1 hypothetical protein SAMN05443429_10877 [Cruoricaptor ignavus]